MEHFDMGYQAGESDKTAPLKVVLRSVTKSDFELLTAFWYQPLHGPVIEVPTHPNNLSDSTDLASVPPLLWGLLPSYGRQLRAALLHDRLCDGVNQRPHPGDPHRDRRRADDIFLEAMRDPGDRGPEDMAKRVPWFRSQLFWAGVSLGRYWQFRKPLAALLTAHVVAGVLAADLIVRLPPLGWIADRLAWSWMQDNGILILIWLVALGFSVVWGRDWKLPFIGLLVGPLILPVLLVTFVVQLVLGIPDGVLRRISPDQPPANYGPSVRRTKT